MAAEAGRVTMQNVHAVLVRVEQDVLSIKSDLKTLNGRVGQNCTDIAVLKEQHSETKSDWEKLWSLASPVVTAIATALLMRQLP